jgi:hypothetical protein
MVNVKNGQLTLGGQFEAYKRGQLERKIQSGRVCSNNCVKVKSIKLNNFDHHGKTTIEKERKENAFGRNNS